MSQTNFISRDRCSGHFDRSFAPALVIDPETVVTFETGDAAYERLWNGESPETIADDEFNRVTGPVFVRGAEAGDVLRIEILEIALQRVWAVWLPDYGPLGGFTDRVQIQPVPLLDGMAQISDRLSVPVEPMIGCIGLAPAAGRASTLEPAYPFGGNLDLRELSPGATLLLPVQVPGGLLSLGDLHAAMGQGEPAWISLEAAGRATVRIGLEKQVRFRSPRVKTKDATLCIAVKNLEGALEDAVEDATRQAYDLLTTERGYLPFEAYAYLCARVGLRFGGPASPIVLAVVPDES